MRIESQLRIGGLRSLVFHDTKKVVRRVQVFVQILFQAETLQDHPPDDLVQRGQLLRIGLYNLAAMGKKNESRCPSEDLLHLTGRGRFLL